MQVRFAPEAVEKISAIYQYISDYQDNAPAAYQKIDDARLKATEMISNNPHCGRELDKSGARFITVNHYVFCYTIHAGEAIIFTLHGSGEDWRKIWL